jgi:hypothetical protein
MWSGRTDAGFNKRPLGIHESQKEILAGTYHHCHVIAGSSDCHDAGIRGGTLYLYTFLAAFITAVITPRSRAGLTLMQDETGKGY